MTLHITQTDEAFLHCLGEDASRLLCNHDFCALAKRFGYAMAFGRKPEEALKADLISCLNISASGIETLQGHPLSVAVKYFQPGQGFLVALIECVSIWNGNSPILLEIVITNKNQTHCACIEDISRYS